MEISITAIRSVEDPYQAFVDSIKNSETRRKYTNLLHHFLKLVPNSIYEEYLGKTPEDNTKETLCKFFVDLADTNPKLAHNVIAAYVKEIRIKFENESLSPNSFSNYIKPIRRLLDANSIQIHWNSIHRQYPREHVSEDRAYTREELQKTAIDHTEAMSTPIMRFLQIFEKTKNHVAKLHKPDILSLNKNPSYENTMNFDEFWKQLQSEIKQEKEFRTLRRRKKFTASFEISTRGIPAVRIITEDGAPRGPIKSNEFQGVWDNAKGYSRETRFLNKGKRLEPYPTKNKGMGKSMQVSYITALIDYIVKDQNMA